LTTTITHLFNLQQLAPTSHVPYLVIAVLCDDPMQRASKQWHNTKHARILGGIQKPPTNDRLATNCSDNKPRQGSLTILPRYLHRAGHLTRRNEITPPPPPANRTHDSVFSHEQTRKL